MPFDQLSPAKVVVLVEAEAGVDRGGLRAALRANAPAWIGAIGGRGAACFVAEPRSPWPQQPVAEPGFDACLEFRADDARVALARLAEVLVRHGAVAHGYGARENVVKGVAPAQDPAPPHGVTMVAAWTRRADVAVAEALRHWREHEPLALAVHHGADRYVQTWLEAPLTAGAPPHTGIATLRFASLPAIATGLFRSPADVAAIEADVAEFIANTVVVYADEIR